jgi:hypothetical protein
MAIKEGRMDYAIIDMLCSTITIMSDVINKQAELLAQMELSDELADELKLMRNDVDTHLNIAGIQSKEI